MDRRIIIIAALLIIAICLISGGCSTFVGDDSLKAWKELLSLAPEEDSNNNDGSSITSLEDLLLDNRDSSYDSDEYISVSLYYMDSGSSKLAVEDREIVKTEGIARKTMQELLKGPENPDYSSVIPEGTRLLDINIKPDGLCIVDLSQEVREISSEEQERLVVYAITNTLGKFPSVRALSFMINGQETDYIAGYMDLSNPIEPDYNQ